MRTILCLLLLATVGAVWANDGRVVASSGRVHRIHDKKTTVQMVRETVAMDVYPDTYTVTATFLFHNAGPATTVTMGFPEGGGGDLDGREYRRKTGFLTFATTVDGTTVTARRETASVGEEGEGYNTFWTKTVAFAKDQSHTVQVCYRSPAGGSVGSTFTCGYDFTGGNWRGEVEESLLTVHLHLAGTYLIDASAPMQRKGETLAHRWTHWQAEEDFFLSATATRPDAWRIAGTNISGNSDPDAIAVSGDLFAFPGTVEPDWLPPVIEKNGTLCIGLAALTTLLRDEAESAKVPEARRPTLDWDEKANTATLTYGTHVLRITPYQPVIHDGDTAITLPAAPFRTKPGRDYMVPSALFVPATAVVQLLGGTVTPHPETRTLAISLPQPAGIPPAEPKKTP